MSVVVFARHHQRGVNGLEPGHYLKSLDPRPDRCGWCIVMCPTCHRLLTLGKNHRVAADGSVSPSLVCPHTPCAFHAFVRLEGWADEERR